jgi:hypothetical protein
VDGIRPEYVSDVEGFLSNWMSRYDSKTVHYTPQLLAWTNTTVRLLPQPAGSSTASGVWYLAAPPTLYEVMTCCGHRWLPVVVAAQAAALWLC